MDAAGVLCLPKKGRRQRLLSGSQLSKQVLRMGRQSNLAQRLLAAGLGAEVGVVLSPETLYANVPGMGR